MAIYSAASWREFARCDYSSMYPGSISGIRFYIHVEYTDSSCIGEHIHVICHLSCGVQQRAAVLSKNPLTCLSLAAPEKRCQHTHWHTQQRELGNRWRGVLCLLGYI